MRKFRGTDKVNMISKQEENIGNHEKEEIEGAGHGRENVALK